MTGKSAPLAACGLVLSVLALLTLARPRADAAPATVRSEPEPVPNSTQRQRLLEEEPIDVNVATAAELELLPRIGPTLALRIIEERERGGRFGSIEELTRVRGIGPRTLERLRPMVMTLEANVVLPLAP